MFLVCREKFNSHLISGSSTLPTVWITNTETGLYKSQTQQENKKIFVVHVKKQMFRAETSIRHLKIFFRNLFLKVSSVFHTCTYKSELVKISMVLKFNLKFLMAECYLIKFSAFSRK